MQCLHFSPKHLIQCCLALHFKWEAIISLPLSESQKRCSLQHVGKKTSQSGEGLSKAVRRVPWGLCCPLCPSHYVLQMFPSGTQLPALRALFSMEMICISAKGIQICFAARPICRGLFSQVLQPPAPASSALLTLVFAARKVNKYLICIQFPQFCSLTLCRNTG